MLYDKLALDLQQAEEALGVNDRVRASDRLLHAQDIVLELLSSLDLESWDGAKGLASLYSYLVNELIGANVSGDAARVNGCRQVIEPLREAWRGAAAVVAAEAPVANANAGGVA
jgi:flagellar protein FliS